MLATTVGDWVLVTVILAVFLGIWWFRSTEPNIEDEDQDSEWRGDEYPQGERGDPPDPNAVKDWHDGPR